MTFAVRFYRGYAGASDRSYVETGRAATLAEAAAIRFVSGDLVVEADTGRLAEPAEAWMWGWERDAGRQSYAWRLVQRQRGER